MKLKDLHDSGLETATITCRYNDKGVCKYFVYQDCQVDAAPIGSNEIEEEAIDEAFSWYVSMLEEEKREKEEELKDIEAEYNQAVSVGLRVKAGTEEKAEPEKVTEEKINRLTSSFNKPRKDCYTISDSYLLN